MISVGIIEDENEIRNDLVSYFNKRDSFICKIHADSVENYFQIVKNQDPPDILLIDIGLPGMSGLEGIKLIKTANPEIDIVVLTIYDDNEKIFNALVSGASGYLLKNSSFSMIREALLELKNGGAPMTPQIARKVIDYFNQTKSQPITYTLTDREKEIVVGLVDGLSYKSISERMGISLETVRSFIKKIYKKLHVNSKVEVIKKSLSGEIN